MHHDPRSLTNRAMWQSDTGGQGISRLSREAFPHMLGVSDRAGPRRISRYRYAECGFPPLSCGVGGPERVSFAAQHQACTHSCQRLAPAFAGNDA